jgi:hypothetical protein
MVEALQFHLLQLQIEIVLGKINPDNDKINIIVIIAIAIKINTVIKATITNIQIIILIRMVS